MSSADLAILPPSPSAPPPEAQAPSASKAAPTGGFARELRAAADRQSQRETQGTPAAKQHPVATKPADVPPPEAELAEAVEVAPEAEAEAAAEVEVVVELADVAPETPEAEPAEDAALIVAPTAEAPPPVQTSATPTLLALQEVPTETPAAESTPVPAEIAPAPTGEPKAAPAPQAAAPAEPAPEPAEPQSVVPAMPEIGSAEAEAAPEQTPTATAAKQPEPQAAPSVPPAAQAPLSEPKAPSADAVAATVVARAAAPTTSQVEDTHEAPEAPTTAAKPATANTAAQPVEPGAAEKPVKAEAPQMPTAEATPAEADPATLSQAGGDAPTTPDPAANPASNTAPPARTAPAAEAAAAPQRPQPAAPPAAEQVAIQVAKAASTGESRITVNLQPAELGRVEVTLDFGSDGKVAAAVRTDRLETLDALQRDARSLERALADAGLKTDSNSLSFSLRRDAQEGFAERQGQQNGPRGNQQNFAFAAPAHEVAAAQLRTMPSLRALDIRV